jgi:signal transduction histidine kinase
MAAIGALVGTRMEDGVLQRSASETALNMDSLVKPLVQELASGHMLSQKAQDGLAALLTGNALGRDVVGIKIWSPSGMVVYGTQPDIIGRTYPMSKNRRQAFAGAVVAEFDDLIDAENEYERSFNTPLLEVYAPIRESGSNRIIAIAEFYEIADNLQLKLRNVRLSIWTAVGTLTVTMITVVTGMILKLKRRALEQRVAELSRLLAENRELQVRIRKAHLLTADINEMFLRRVSADLHDAPAQLLGFVLLRLDSLRPQKDKADQLGRGAKVRRHVSRARSADGSGEFEVIRGALVETLNEIRTISEGLAPPELADVSLAKALEMAATHHAKRTQTDVECNITGLPEGTDPALKICLYRFTQEGLNNAFRHAGGCGQQLHARCNNGLLEVIISDDGAGPAHGVPQSRSTALGLRGLRARIESIGGEFDFRLEAGQGARLTARFHLANTGLSHA